MANKWAIAKTRIAPIVAGPKLNSTYSPILLEFIDAEFEDNGPGQGFSKQLKGVHPVPQLIKFNAKQMNKVTRAKENIQAIMAIVVPTMQFVSVISSVADQKLIAEWLVYLIGLVILLPYYATFSDYRRHRVTERRHYYYLLAHNTVMDLLNRKIWQNKAFNFGLFYCLFISIVTFSGPIPWGTYLSVVAASAVYLKVAVDLSNAESQLVSFNKVLEEVTYKEISVMNYINEQWLYAYLHHKEAHRKEVVAKIADEFLEAHPGWKKICCQPVLLWWISKRMTMKQYHDNGYIMDMAEFKEYYNAHEHLKPEANLKFIQVPRCFFLERVELTEVAVDGEDKAAQSENPITENVGDQEKSEDETNKQSETPEPAKPDDKKPIQPFGLSAVPQATPGMVPEPEGDEGTKTGTAPEHESDKGTTKTDD